MAVAKLPYRHYVRLAKDACATLATSLVETAPHRRAHSVLLGSTLQVEPVLAFLAQKATGATVAHQTQLSIPALLVLLAVASERQAPTFACRALQVFGVVAGRQVPPHALQALLAALVQTAAHAAFPVQLAIGAVALRQAQHSMPALQENSVHSLAPQIVPTAPPALQAIGAQQRQPPPLKTPALLAQAAQLLVHQAILHVLPAPQEDSLLEEPHPAPLAQLESTKTSQHRVSASRVLRDFTAVRALYPRVPASMLPSASLAQVTTWAL